MWILEDKLSSKHHTLYPDKQRFRHLSDGKSSNCACVLCTCLFIYVSACMIVCMHVFCEGLCMCMHTWHAWLCVQIIVCACQCSCICCMRVCMHMHALLYCVYVWHACVCMYIVYMHMYAWLYMQVYMFFHVFHDCVCMHSWMFTCLYVHVCRMLSSEIKDSACFCAKFTNMHHYAFFLNVLGIELRSLCLLRHVSEWPTSGPES